MEEVFYRKYRPGTFSEVVGQSHIVDVLRESVKTSRLTHAYLFCGPRGTGKTTVARIMAKALNCLNFEEVGDICNTCQNCEIINKGNAIDIIEMDAASNRGIEEIRNLKDNINFVPTVLKKKIYIVDEAHMLTKEAFNALLKTLEEPPAHVVFIFATTEPHKIPVTILSRVQRYDFRLAELSEISSKIKLISDNESIKISPSAVETIYKHTGGSYRDAESLFSKITSQFGKEISEDNVITILGVASMEDIDFFADLLMQQNLAQSLDFLSKLIAGGLDVSTLVDQLITRLREKMMEKVEKKQAASLENLVYLANCLIESKREMRYFSDKSSILHLAILKFFSTVKDLGSDSINPSTGQPKKSNPESPTPVKKVEVKNEIPKKEVLTNGAPSDAPAGAPSGGPKGLKLDSSSFVKSVESNLSTPNTRLRAILSTSDIIDNGNVIVIRNRYKFNLDYLEKLEIKTLLLTSAKSINDIVSAIEFSKLEADFNTTVVSEIKSASRQEEKARVPSHVSDAQGSENSDSATEEFDNSDLVESML